MLGIPQFCNLFVCVKRLILVVIFLSVVYRVLHSDNPCLIIVIRWENNKIYGAMLILVSYTWSMKWNMSYFCCIWNQIIENGKQQDWKKKSTLSQRYSYVTLASKNYSWKFCYITIEILFWSSVIVFDAGTISLVYFSVPVTSTFIELQIVSSSVWIFFFKSAVVRYFFPKFSIAALCSIPWEYVFCYKWQHEVNVCSRFAMFRAWFDRRFVFRVMGNL